ncbi:hypothetical protein Tco_0199315 [Tanacetum coccineum]
MVYQPHSTREISGLGTTKDTKPESQASSSKTESGSITIQSTKPSTSPVPTIVKTNDHDTKLDSQNKALKNESSKLVRPIPLQKPKLKCKQCNYTNHSTDDSYRILYSMIRKYEDQRTSDHASFVESQKHKVNYKVKPYQYASSSKQVSKPKVKPFLPCTHSRFNDHRPDNYINYPECEIYGSYEHATSGHNRVIYVKYGVLAESSQLNESSTFNK